MSSPMKMECEDRFSLLCEFRPRLLIKISERNYCRSSSHLLTLLALLRFYEADRCVKQDPRCQGLKLFQKRQAFYQIAMALIDTLDFLTPRQKEEILWRTGKSKEPLTDDLAWRRVRVIHKSLDQLAKTAEPFVVPGRPHSEIVDKTVQFMFEQFDNNKGRTVPPSWEFAHNHAITTFRVYYVGATLDPNFPSARSPVQPTVSETRPNATPVQRTPNRMINLTDGGPVPGSAYRGDEIDVERILGNPAEERRKLLKEVREHLDILKEFEGVIDEEDLKKRKRALYDALPVAPPPSKEAKQEEDATNGVDEEAVNV